MMRPTSRLFLLVTLLIDSVTIVGLALFARPVMARLAEPSGLNAVLLAAAYLPFLAGTFLLRKLQPIPPANGAWLTPTWRGVLAGVFGLVMTTMLAWQLGFFRSIPAADPMVLGEGEAAAYFVFAPGAWLGVSMLYILFLAFPVNETVAPGEARHGIFAVAGLVSAAFMLAMTVFQAGAMLPGGSRWLWFVVGLLLLAVLFGPPRILFASRVLQLPSRPATIALLSLALVLAAGAWLGAAG